MAGLGLCGRASGRSNRMPVARITSGIARSVRFETLWAYVGDTGGPGHAPPYPL